MSERIALIARIGAALATAAPELHDVLSDALAALVEDHGAFVKSERRKERDRNRKRGDNSTESEDSTDSKEYAERRESAEAAPPSPQVSSSFPTPHITPSFPPTPHPLPRAREELAMGEQELLERAPLSAPLISGFLAGMPFAKRLGWVTVFAGAMDEGPRLSDAELSGALSSFCATVERHQWTAAYFRGYCRSVRTPLAVPKPTKDEAGKVFAQIRALVTHTPNPGRGVIRIIPKTAVAALGATALSAYEQIGGADRFLDPDEKLGFLLRDFEKAYNANAEQFARPSPDASPRVPSIPSPEIAR